MRRLDPLIYTETHYCRNMLASWVKIRNAPDNLNRIALEDGRSAMIRHNEEALKRFGVCNEEFGYMSPLSEMYINLGNELTPAIWKANDLIKIGDGAYVYSGGERHIEEWVSEAAMDGVPDKAVVNAKLKFICEQLRNCLDHALKIDDFNNRIRMPEE